ncbi:uncharacterized protein METZ01_LOCUS466961, partial [marine metagenome]
MPLAVDKMPHIPPIRTCAEYITSSLESLHL